jgi:hypothetical protein
MTQSSQAHHETAHHTHFPASRLLFRGGNLVADTLADDLALELREGQQHVEGQRPIEVVVLNCCVTETNEAPIASRTSTILAKSASERVSRSILVDDHDVDPPRDDVREQLPQAGRSIVAPENPPSSYVFCRQIQPSCRWLLMKASHASRCACSELNSCSSPSSEDLRV